VRAPKNPLRAHPLSTMVEKLNGGQHSSQQ